MPPPVEEPYPTYEPTVSGSAAVGALSAGAGTGVTAGGAGVAFGAGVEAFALAETTVIEADAATTVGLFEFPFDVRARARSVCLPSATAVGSTMRALKLPDRSVVGAGSQALEDPSHVSCTLVAVGKPEPVAVRLLPGTGAPRTARVGVLWPVAR
jgi:hypothetical protein